MHSLSKITLRNISLALIVFVSLFLSIRQIYSVDIGFHLQAGKWMAENLSFPDNDTFTYTANNNKYIDLYWLYQLLLYGTYSFLGSTGIILLNSFMILTALMIVFIQVKHSSVFLPWILLLGILAISPIFEIRPHSLSWLFLSITIYILHKYYEGNEKIIQWLPLVMLIWVNTHSLFVLGIIVTGCYAVSVLFRKKNLRKRFIVFSSIAILCCFINPYGWNGFLLPFEQLLALQEGSVFKENIREFQSPFSITSYEISTLFKTWHFFDLFLIVIFISFLILRKKIKIHEWLIAAIFFYFACSATKNIGYFVFAVLPCIARSGEIKNRAESFAQKNSKYFYSIFIAACILVILSVSTNAFYIHYRMSYRFGTGWSNSTLPVKAVAFMERNNIKGKILNTLDYGGYLEFFTQQKTSIDGRLEVMGKDIFSEQAFELNDQKRRNIIEKHKPDIILFPYSTAPDWIPFLRKQPDWRLAFADETSAMYFQNEYRRDILPLNEEYFLASFPVISDERINEMIKLDRNTTVFSSFLKPQYYPEAEFNLTAFCFYYGWINTAKQIMSSAFEKSTNNYPELYLNFGTVFFQQRNASQSLFCYEKYLESNNNKQVEERVKFLKTKL